jgi:hypothetical protein
MVSHDSFKLMHFPGLHIGQTYTKEMIWKDNNNTKFSIQMKEEDAIRTVMSLESRPKMLIINPLRLKDKVLS